MWDAYDRRFHAPQKTPVQGTFQAARTGKFGQDLGLFSGGPRFMVPANAGVKVQAHPPLSVQP